MLTPEVPTPALSGFIDTGVRDAACLLLSLPPSPTTPQHDYFTRHLYIPYVIVILVLLVSAEDYGLYKYHSRCVVSYYRVICNEEQVVFLHLFTKRSLAHTCTYKSIDIDALKSESRQADFISGFIDQC